MIVRTIAGVCAAVTVLLALVVVKRPDWPAPVPVVTTAAAPARAASTNAVGSGLLYGRVTTTGGDVLEGRLRFGGDEEALWSNTFNGFKAKNPWVAYVPADELPRERHAVKVWRFELSVADPSRPGRPFMARFGDIARLEADGRDLVVTLRSGSVVHLDRYAADDYADGVRVWDAGRGVVDLDERHIRSIDFLPTGAVGTGPEPLYGTVRTRQGEFTGLIQWNRRAALGSDELAGETDGGATGVPFGDIRAIARRSPESALVTLRDGRTIVLGATRTGYSGVYVDDARYGRVLVSWDAFERLDFRDGHSGPAYDDYAPGRPLTGTVLTRSGRRLAGRLVYDLDESESTETLDAPWQGVDYTIPFARIASIVPAGAGSAAALVTLTDGAALQLEASGDLADSNGGLLVFTPGVAQAAYVRWSDVARIDLDAPTSM